jgi:hypothetical protein
MKTQDINTHYVYIYCDPRKQGLFKYDELVQLGIEYSKHFFAKAKSSIENGINFEIDNEVFENAQMN